MIALKITYINYMDLYVYMYTYACVYIVRATTKT